MIFEGLVTTVDVDGLPHLAPMGPRFDDQNLQSFVLRPFPTSRSYQNLLRQNQGVFHLTDDALLLAKATIGQLQPIPPMVRATHIEGNRLADCCSWFEFQIVEVNDRNERINMTAQILHHGIGRPWTGFNRAKHAIVEAAILASRLHILPREQIETEFAQLAVIVDKTGGAAELQAMQTLQAYVRRMA
jgi:hypothetical protein